MAATAQPRIGLDNPAFYGRLGSPNFANRQRSVYLSRAKSASARSTRVQSLVLPLQQPVAKPIFQSNQTTQPAIAILKPQPFAKPGMVRQQKSEVLRRQVATPISQPQPNFQPAFKQPKRTTKRSKQQLALVTMAVAVFVFGVAASIQTVLTNHASAHQVAAISKAVDATTATTTGSDGNAAPSTTKPSAKAVASYAVAPDLAKYIKIPKLGVSARVLQVGITTSGALGTPSNVFDTAWYTGSAKPGQDGATLIDGHVSSWTTKGVFYGIKTLVAGDKIQIVKGDNTVLTYKVVKSQTYPDTGVDMQAAVTSAQPGVSGLNLITCTGQVKKGTSEFNQRVLVFAVQV